MPVKVNFKLAGYGMAEVSFENCANYDIDFTSGEITERFRRGDSSRLGQGSGLGLAIAKAYMQLCKGIFGIKIDGRRFTVTVGVSVMNQ